MFTADSYAEDQAETDVENLIERSLFLKLVAATYDLPRDERFPAKRPKDAPVRVTNEAEEHFRMMPADIPEYDHFAPSRYSIEHPSGCGSLSDDALVRFESRPSHLSNTGERANWWAQACKPKFNTTKGMLSPAEMELGLFLTQSFASQRRFRPSLE